MSERSEFDQTLHALRYDKDQRFEAYEGQFKADLDVVLIKIRISRSGRKFIKIINLAIMCSAINSQKNTYVLLHWEGMYDFLKISLEQLLHIFSRSKNDPEKVELLKIPMDYKQNESP